MGTAHYLYDNQSNRVLTNSANASATTDTIYFDNYTDQRLDSQSGLLYYNFRWYDPVTRQFARTYQASVGVFV
ncbi:MAG: hypothetical protein ACRDHZ_17740 [Ktedonobacteraceae bacterium]